MDWLAIGAGLIRIVTWCLRRAEQDRHEDAGRTKEALRHAERTLALIGRAQAARRALRHDPGSLRDDPDRR